MKEQPIILASDKLIKVSSSKFAEMSKRIWCLELSEEKPVKSVMYQGNKYVITGAVGTGTGEGWSQLQAYKVVPLALYQGGVEPMTYRQAINAVYDGKRQRGYNGMLIKCDGAPYVMVGPKITILEDKDQNDSQLDLFQ